MDGRKRKRIIKATLPITQFLSRKHALLFFILFVLFILNRGYNSRPFRPAPIAPQSALFSLSINNSVHDFTIHQKTGSMNSGGEKPMELRVENRVVFPDYILVILSIKENGPPSLQQRVDCVYHKQLDSDSVGEVTVTYPMLSADEYGKDRWTIQCPLPPANYTSIVGLRGHRDDLAEFEWVAGMGETNKTAQLWDYLAYDATLDGNNTVAIFVKGLHLKSDRESDATCFRCHFGRWGLTDKNEGGSEDVELTTMAITAAQEVIRCPLPPP